MAVHRAPAPPRRPAAPPPGSGVPVVPLAGFGLVLVAVALAFWKGASSPAPPPPTPVPVPAGPDLAKAVVPNAKPAAAPVPGGDGGTYTRSFSPVRFFGNGSKVTAAFAIEPGLYVLEAEHSGRGRFSVSILETGEKGYPAHLVSALGPYNRQQAVRIDKKGDCVLQVEADGGWMVSLAQPDSSVPLSTDSRLPREEPTPAFVPTPVPANAEAIERMNDAIQRHDWIVSSHPGAQNSAEAREAERRANDAAREAGQSLPFPNAH